MRPIIIIGFGGTSFDVVDLLESVNNISPNPVWDCIGFLDDNDELHNHKYNSIPVLGNLSKAGEFNSDICFAFTIASPNLYKLRESIFNKMGINKSRFPVLIHPVSSISSASIGSGSIIFPNTTISSTAVLGDFSMVLSGSVINHHCQIGDFTSLASNVTVSGGVSIGRCSYLGAGSCIKDNIPIGQYSLIGLGSVVTKDIAPESVVVGNPARNLHSHPTNEVDAGIL